MQRTLTIQTPHGPLHGQIELPAQPRGLVVLARAHHVPLDAIIAAGFGSHGYASLGIELLSTQEAQFADATQNVPRLTQRLIDILELIHHDAELADLPLAIFANGDTAPAAIRAAAQRDIQVKVVAGHGGIIDRAGLQPLTLLSAPLLMLFDSTDLIGKTSFERAATHLECSHAMQILEAGEDPVTPTAAWFARYMPAAAAA